MKLLFILFAALFLFGQAIFAQQIVFVDSSQKGISFRGLSVVSDSILWISGSKGTVGKSINGGKNISWMKPKGFENRDFRDIEAFDNQSAIIMAIDSPGIILKTKDGGENWKVVYKSNEHGIFLDAMAFKNNLRGVCVGDPIEDHFWLIETNDGGDSWRETAPSQCPEAAKGEACFASSGTNIQFLEKHEFEFAFVSGGKKSNVYLLGKGKHLKKEINVMKGMETTGANSLAVNGNKFVMVGGDFTHPLRNDSTIEFWHKETGEKRLFPQKLGYKSCVIFNGGKTWIATGLSGTDLTLNDLTDWKHISDLPFHVVQKAKKGTAVFMAGGNGKIAKIIF